MYRSTKSATCCYCGAETVLVMSEGARHELKCGSCGAPVSRLKSLKTRHVEDAYTVRGKRDRKPYQPQRPKKSKKKKKGFGYYLKEAAEEIFDIFD